MDNDMARGNVMANDMKKAHKNEMETGMMQGSSRSGIEPLLS